MSKLIKIGIVVSLLLLLLVASAVFWIDGIARLAVEKGATHALGVPTTLESMRIGLFSGHAGMRELVVKNPPGFRGAHFLRLGAGDLGVSLGSLLSDRIVVPKIHLSGIDLLLENGPAGTNLSAILANLQRGKSGANETTPAQPTPSPAATEGTSKRFVVEEILIESVRVGGTLEIPGLGPKTVSYQIPQIRLQNVGSDGDGASLARLSAEIVKAILKGAIEQGKDLPKEIVQEWKTKGEALRESLREQGQDLKGKAEELKGLFRKKKD